jgi:hypothetical protein
MENLTSLFNKYQSDKGTIYGTCHDYGEFYEKYLGPLKSLDLVNGLEIGIYNGASLKVFEEYFPKVFMIGLDIDDKSHLQTPNISTGILDQSNDNSLKLFYNHCIENNHYFDFILDDGSHHMLDQQLTLGYLFPLLKPGGIYIIEDLHTSIADDGFILYGRPLDTFDYKKTTLSYLEDKAQYSHYLDDEKNRYIRDNIKDVIISTQINPNQQPQYKYKSITAILIKHQ